MADLQRTINSDRRAYFINKVNAPIVWLIILGVTLYARRYPEPTHDNVVFANAHRLLDIRDEFFKRWKTKPRAPLYEAFWRGLIVKYVHSATYRCMFDWLLMMCDRTGWKPFDPDRQMHCWKGE